MKRIRQRKMRYGNPEFDRDYLKWGFHDEATQRKEAQSVLDLANAEGPLEILDLACGHGAHAAYWARQGHHVLAIDVSETFIAEAKRRHGPVATLEFCVKDIKAVRASGTYDLVTWVERSFFDQEMCQIISSALKPNGLFVTDVRNPNHPKTKRNKSDWRTWRQGNGVFFLEKHETDPATGVHEDLWITVDPENGTVLEEYELSPQSEDEIDNMKQLLCEAGVTEIELKTMMAEPFTGGSQSYWLWLVARKN